MTSRPLPLLVTAVALWGVTAANGEEMIYEASQVEVQPKIIKMADVSYPGDLRVDGVEGLATLEFVLTADGKVTDIKCVATNDPKFGAAAIERIRKSRFEAGQIKGRAVSTRCRRTDEFRLIRSSVKGLRVRPTGPDAKKVTAPTELTFKAFEGAQVGFLNTAPLSYQGTNVSYVGNVRLVYPLEALVAGTAGQVEVQFEIGKDARVHALQVVQASAPEFALAAVARLTGSWFKSDHPGPFVASFDFRPNGNGDAELDGFDKALLKLLRTRPEEIRASGFDVRPKPLRTVRPDPPANQSVAGKALIEVLVDVHGGAHLPRVVSCSAPEFGANAAHAAALWLFAPAQIGGKAVASRVQIPFSFELVQPPR